MKRNLLRRIGAVVLAVAVSLIMGVTCFAETTATPTRDGGTVSSDTSLTITKEIAFFNPQSAKQINYPTVEYTYSIASANPNGATVTDSNNHKATVKQGVNNGVVMGTDNTAKFTGSSVAASSTGKILSDTFDVSVDLNQFSAAGIYRYAITEAAPDNLAALGYERATASVGTRYLDVYILNILNGDSGLKVGGYVLFFGSATDSIVSTDQTAKTTGFVHEASTEDYKADTYIDKYKTYNVEIAKTVAGAMGDKSNLFPIKMSVEAGASASDVAISGSIKTQTSGSASAQNITLASGAAIQAVVANLADGDVAQFIGIPVKSTLKISENNNTADTYTVTATGLSGVPASEQVVAEADSTEGAVTTTAVETKSVSFTNDLSEVSPTNVVMRYAPFLFIFAAAILLLVVMRRRRTHDAE